VDVLGQPEFDFSCDVSGGIGTVAVDGGLALCGAGGSLDINTGYPSISAFIGEESYPAGSQISVVATPGTGYELTSMTGCTTGDGISTPCAVVMGGNQSVTASFALIDENHQVDALASSDGVATGSVELYWTDPYAGGPPDMTCGPFVTCFVPKPGIPNGAVIRFNAVADEGSTFDSWLGPCMGATGAECWLEVVGDIGARPFFVPEPYVLNLDVGANGQASDDEGNGPCGPSDACEYSYAPFDAGETLTITATPNPGYVAAWDANCTAPARNVCTLVPEQSMSVYVDFELEPVTLTLTIVPTWTVSDGGGNTCVGGPGAAPCTWQYTAGDTVTLTITDFGGAGAAPVWYPQATCVEGGYASTCTTTMDANQSISLEVEPPA
jgi:hypothetical protein